jgi:hypothetical protein
MRIASRLNRIEPSPSSMGRQGARELRVAGRDIVSLTTGEPDFEPPDHVKEAERNTGTFGASTRRRVLCVSIVQDFSGQAHPEGPHDPNQRRFRDASARIAEPGCAARKRIWSGGVLGRSSYKRARRRLRTHRARVSGARMKAWRLPLAAIAGSFTAVSHVPEN